MGAGQGLRERVVARTPFDDNDGASGATLERARLDDGTALILKTFDPARDLTMLIPGRTVPLDVELWQAGVLDRLPAEVGHAVRDAWREDGRWVVAMADVGTRLLSYNSRLSRTAGRGLLTAAAALHGAFRSQPLPGLWPTTERIALFAPRVMTRYEHGENPLPAWCLEGWRQFDALAPTEVRDLVHRVHADPAVLAAPLTARSGVTLLHGDFWTPNLAPEPDRVVAIDWALATLGPPVPEYVSFLVGCGGQVDATRDDVLDDVRAVLGDDTGADEDVLRAGMVFGVVEMGWNLAWQVAHDPSPTARDTFDWWVEAARRGAATGLLAE